MLSQSRLSIGESAAADHGNAGAPLNPVPISPSRPRCCWSRWGQQ